MADEQEQRDAREKHDRNMSRLQTLRDDVRGEISDIIDRYYERIPSDMAYARDESGYIIDDLRRVQRRIDETIENL